MLFKMKYYNGLNSGLLCVGLCLLDFLGCFTLCFFIADTYFKIERFTFTFHGLRLIQFKRDLYVKYVYLGFYFFFNILIFLLILCFVIKIKNNIESKNEIFMFISGFNLAFIFPFTFSMLVGLGVFREAVLFGIEDFGDEYHSILLSFDFFVLSYLFQLNGVILLIFIWLRNNKIKLIFYIALGTLFLPFIILLISLVVQMRS